MPSNTFGNATEPARAWARRHWLRGVWGNPLARSADRWQSGLRIVLIASWALALPVAATLSSILVADGLHAAEESANERAQTPAVLLADAPRILVVSTSADLPTPVQVQASWFAPDGTPRSGPVSTSPGTPAGTHVDIWIDMAGTQVAAPERPATAVGAGVLIGGGLWLALGSVLAGVFWLSVLSLNRGRRADWDREWLKLAPH
jgi:hypothetical protein